MRNLGDIIRKNPRITRKELVYKLGIERSTLDYRL